MNAAASGQRPLRLREWAAVFALAIAMAAGAWLLYRLLDVVLLVFLGMTVAAALQPWHAKLCDLGVPRGVAVLLIYLLFALLLAGLGVLAVPPLAEEIGRLLATVPEMYASLLSTLRGSSARVLRIFGNRLPPFEALPATLTGLSGDSVQGIFGLTTGVLGLFTWIVAVLAIAFYWTLDVPRVERLMLSLVPVARRTQALGAWREVESKLGAYFRAQGIAMLAVGVASGVGYVLIGLPNAVALAVLAGLFEGLPLIGPFLAAVPALIAAVSLGLPAVLLTLGWSVIVQTVEGNVLVPRLMSHAVGVSELVSLIAILAFGTVYGVLGVFLAIPLAAVVQVLLDRLVLDPDVQAEPAEPTALPGLRARARTLRQRVRTRLRERSVRMGIDPDTPAHVADAADQQLEEAVERITDMIRVAQRTGRATDEGERARMLAALHGALEGLEGAVARADAVATPEDEASSEALPLDELTRATTEAGEAVEGVEAAMGPAEERPPEVPAPRLDRP